MSGFRRCVPFVLALLLIAPGQSLTAKNGAFRSSAHGSGEKGPMRQKNAARGSCAQCHGGHASHEPGGGGRREFGLFGPNDNTLCFACHGLPSQDGAFGGSSVWLRSSHGTSSQVYGGGSDPQRNAEVNRCVNCHDPHGVRDRDGVVPAMLASREPELCLSCHNGSRGADVYGETMKSWTHGMNARGVHDPHEGERQTPPAAYSPADRHVSCSDCHNSHVAAPDRSRPDAPEASAVLAGVARVKVINGPAGTAPSYTFVGAEDPAPPNEYEVCFRCHSSYVKQPPQQENLALLTNPENPSFHPIQALGKNRNIRADAFTGDYDATSILLCTDCHASDNDRIAGPHGSRYQYLLKKDSLTSTDRRSMQKDNLCFGCHSWDVYADPESPATTLTASRFNGPASAGHAFHVGLQRITCYSCHETHGSTRYPALIATGRGRELLSYSQTPTGGTCNASCHVTKTYTLNYER